MSRIPGQSEIPIKPTATTPLTIGVFPSTVTKNSSFSVVIVYDCTHDKLIIVQESKLNQFLTTGKYIVATASITALTAFQMVHGINTSPLKQKCLIGEIALPPSIPTPAPPSPSPPSPPLPPPKLPLPIPPVVPPPGSGGGVSNYPVIPKGQPLPINQEFVLGPGAIATCPAGTTLQSFGIDQNGKQVLKCYKPDIVSLPPIPPSVPPIPPPQGGVNLPPSLPPAPPAVPPVVPMAGGNPPPIPPQLPPPVPPALPPGGGNPPLPPGIPPQVALPPIDGGPELPPLPPPIPPGPQLLPLPPPIQGGPEANICPIPEPIQCPLPPAFPPNEEIPLPEPPMFEPPPIGDFGRICEQIQMASVGSLEFCEAIDTLVQKLSIPGDYFFKYVLNLDPDTCQPLNKPTASADFWTEVIGQLANSLIPTARIPVEKTVKPILNGLLVGVGFDEIIAGQISTTIDIKSLLTQTKAAICSVFTGLTKCLPCNTRALGAAFAIKALLGILRDIPARVTAGMNFVVEAKVDIEGHLRLVMQPWEIIIDYLIQWACPVRLLDQGECVEAFLRGLIPQNHLNCLLRMHNLSPAFHQIAVEVRKDRLTPEEVINLSMREASGFQRNSTDALRQLGLSAEEAIVLSERLIADLDASGWQNAIDKLGKVGLSVEIPTITDHLEWQRRNVDDPTYTIPFELWAGFDEPAKVKQLMQEFYTQSGYLPQHQKEFDAAWATADKLGVPEFLKARNFWQTFKPDLQAQGMTQRAALFHYMTHWTPIPPTTGYRFLHRLRPDAYPENIAFTRDNLRRVLLEAGWQPTMIDRLIEISYNVITRIDARRAYIAGSIDRTGFLKIVQDQGYTLKNAEVIADFTDITAVDQASRTAIPKLYTQGIITWEDMIDQLKELYPVVSLPVGVDNKVILRLGTTLDAIRKQTLMRSLQSLEIYRSYINALASEEEFLAWMNDNRKITDDERKTLLFEARKKRQRISRKRCLTQIRARIQGGELTPHEAGQAVIALGMPESIAKFKEEDWTCEFAVAWKQPSKQELCKLAQDGLISTDEYTLRLRKLGYDPGATAGLVQDCVLQKIKKAEKVVEDAARRAAAAQGKAQRDNERMKEKALREIQRYVKQSNQLATLIAKAEATANLTEEKAADKAKAAADKADKAAKSVETRAYNDGLSFATYLIKASKGQSYSADQLLVFATWIIHDASVRLKLPVATVSRAAKALVQNYNTGLNPDLINYLMQGLQSYFGTLGALVPPPDYVAPAPRELHPPKPQ